MKLIVGSGSCGNAAGASGVFASLKAGIQKSGLKNEVHITGCIGMCYLEPIVDIIDNNGNKKTYVKVNADATAEILKLVNAEANSAAQYLISQEDEEILHSQNRIALRNCGIINPENIDEYIEREGYKAIKKCLANMTADQVIDEIKVSGLAGRGGAGFPTWYKWKIAKEAAGSKKYIICNADEGDPAAFMDRTIIESDPHAIIEGMMIAAYAISADEGIVYIRSEYPLAIAQLEIAIKQAREHGILGSNIFGSGFSFDVQIRSGLGAYICGEETALIASLEGERGMPRLKPPFPAQKGYWQKPTVVNNVETIVNVPWIIRNGGAVFSAIGTENSRGTKVLALSGKIKNGGLVETAMGKTINDIVYGAGGGLGNGKKFKAVQIGGPDGGCLPEALGGTPIDYKSLAANGATIGSGGIVVMDDTVCMVGTARYFLDFICKESCGKCTHCRIGTARMLEILERICKGNGRNDDIKLLEDLAIEVREGSLCTLGQTAANPVLTTIMYFRKEYEDHIIRKKCTAHQCRPLLSYQIDTGKCTGCTLCKQKCPSGAISGEVKKAHTINMEMCIKCGKCREVCCFGAVLVD